MRIYKLRHHDICDVIYGPGPIQKYDSTSTITTLVHLTSYNVGLEFNSVQHTIILKRDKNTNIMSNNEVDL